MKIKKRINKCLSGLLAGLMLVTSVPVYGLDVSGNDISTETSTEVAETSEEISSSETETSEIVDNMLNISPLDLGDEEESSTDNWELGVVFYDSTVDNGKTPLTSIDWDASDGGYGTGDSRVITVQINYKNTNAVTTYQPGTLELSIPNLSYKTDESNSESAYWTTSIQVAANDSTHTNYPWNFTTGNTPTTDQETYTFTNANIIEEKANFEGSIQIEYTITPKKEYENTHANNNLNYSYWSYIEKYEDECTHTHSISLKATLKDIMVSDTIQFDYSRTYTHPWNYKQYTLTKKASKISSYDNLGENPDNYIWVKYEFSYQCYDDSVYPNIEAKNIYIVDETIPDDCIVYDTQGNEILKTDNYYKIPTSSNGAWWVGPNILGRNMKGTAYVGFPKSIYNNQQNNMTISNVAYLYGQYCNKTEEEMLSSDTETINLADFIFEYSGSLYGINKTGNYPSMRYQDIISDSGNYNIASYTIAPSARWTGSLMTLKIGDDVLYATDQNSNYTKLTDNDYYIQLIRIMNDTDWWKNANGENIAKGKYDCELWIRRAGNQDYELISSFKNGEYVNDKYGHTNGTTNLYEFTAEDKVVGYYIIVKDMKESLISSKITSVEIRFNKKAIPQKGTLVNFSYLQVYLKDTDGNLVLQNEPTEDSYASFVSKELAAYDKQTYGNYLQRSSAKVDWSYYDAKLSPTLIGLKSASKITQDMDEERFSGSFNIGFKFAGDDYYEIYEDQYDETHAIKNIYLYDILPSGMELSSSQTDILNSITINKKNEFRYLNKTIVSDEEFNNIITNNSKVIVTPNYLNSGRTKIEIQIDLTDCPLFICDSASEKRTEILFTYNYAISYDSYLEFGKTHKNYLYIYGLKGDNSEASYFQSTKIKDDGSIDNVAYDINQNGRTDEQLAYVNAEIVISSVISTHQDLQTQVQSTLSNYSIGTVPAEYNGDYTYKLRVRTGQNDVTNLIIYNNLEKWAKDKDGNFIEAAGKKKSWQGEFLGIDTSYAESKGYTVKVYYSENEKTGTLADDTSWKEYTDDIDKTKVKSLAFEYLDSEVNPAVLPANSLTYVLVNMKAPADESITTLAYNGCWTQWNAIDEFGEPVDFITGINSNIVKVSLPNSILDDSIPSIKLIIEKEIQGTDEAFENMKLNPNAEYLFPITLIKQEENEDGSHDTVKGVLSNKTHLTIDKLTFGSWLISESDDIYFDFVDIISNTQEDIDGITFEKTDNGYLLTISEDVEEDMSYSLKVINEIEPNRPYEDKDDKTNMFSIVSPKE